MFSTGGAKTLIHKYFRRRFYRIAQGSSFYIYHCLVFLLCSRGFRRYNLIFTFVQLFLRVIFLWAGIRRSESCTLLAVVGIVTIFCGIPYISSRVDKISSTVFPGQVPVPLRSQSGPFQALPILQILPWPPDRKTGYLARHFLPFPCSLSLHSAWYSPFCRCQHSRPITPDQECRNH